MQRKIEQKKTKKGQALKLAQLIRKQSVEFFTAKIQCGQCVICLQHGRNLTDTNRINVVCYSTMEYQPISEKKTTEIKFN